MWPPLYVTVWEQWRQQSDSSETAVAKQWWQQWWSLVQWWKHEWFPSIQNPVCPKGGGEHIFRRKVSKIISWRTLGFLATKRTDYPQTLSGFAVLDFNALKLWWSEFDWDMRYFGVVSRNFERVDSLSYVSTLDQEDSSVTSMRFFVCRRFILYQTASRTRYVIVHG